MKIFLFIPLLAVVVMGQAVATESIKASEQSDTAYERSEKVRERVSKAYEQADKAYQALVKSKQAAPVLKEWAENKAAYENTERTLKSGLYIKGSGENCRESSLNEDACKRIQNKAESRLKQFRHQYGYRDPEGMLMTMCYQENPGSPYGFDYYATFRCVSRKLSQFRNG